MGRPSKYSDKLVKAICERLSQGEPLAVICRDEGMPSVSTVWQWQRDKTGVSESIACAREIGFDALAAECLDIADETSRDTIVDGEGWRCNSEWITRSRLRVETRLKLLAKWDPKRYGDKTTTELTGKDGKAIELEQKVSEDAAFVASAILGLAARARTPGVDEAPNT